MTETTSSIGADRLPSQRDRMANFVQMLQLNLPHDAIRLKMQLVGFNDGEIDSFLRSKGSDSITLQSSHQSSNDTDMLSSTTSQNDSKKVLKFDVNDSLQSSQFSDCNPMTKKSLIYQSPYKPGSADRRYDRFRLMVSMYYLESEIRQEMAKFGVSTVDCDSFFNDIANKNSDNNSKGIAGFKSRVKSSNETAYSQQPKPTGSGTGSASTWGLFKSMFTSIESSETNPETLAASSTCASLSASCDSSSVPSPVSERSPSRTRSRDNIMKPYEDIDAEWVAILEQDTQKYYYWNRRTGIKSNDHPHTWKTKVKSKSKKARLPPTGANTGKKLGHSSRSGDDSSIGKRGVPVHHVLEEGWIMILDPDRNRYYYWNTRSDVTTWINPLPNTPQPSPPSPTSRVKSASGSSATLSSQSPGPTQSPSQKRARVLSRSVVVGSPRYMLSRDRRPLSRLASARTVVGIGNNCGSGKTDVSAPNHSSATAIVYPKAPRVDSLKSPPEPAGVSAGLTHDNFVEETTPTCSHTPVASCTLSNSASMMPVLLPSIQSKSVTAVTLSTSVPTALGPTSNSIISAGISNKSIDITGANKSQIATGMTFLDEIAAGKKLKPTANIKASETMRTMVANPHSGTGLSFLDQIAAGKKLKPVSHTLTTASTASGDNLHSIKSARPLTVVVEHLAEQKFGSISVETVTDATSSNKNFAEPSNAITSSKVTVSSKAIKSSKTAVHEVISATANSILLTSLERASNPMSLMEELVATRATRHKTVASVLNAAGNADAYVNSNTPVPCASTSLVSHSTNAPVAFSDVAETCRPTSLGIAPTAVDTTTTISTSAKVEDATSHLDPIFDKYRMMKKLKLSEGAIRQKMRTDGLSDRSIGAFFSIQE